TEAHIQAAIGVEPCTVRLQEAVHIIESTADEQFAVRLQRNSVNAAHGGTEGRIATPVGIQPTNSIVAPKDYFAVLLHRQGADVPDCRASRIEGGVKMAISIEPRDVVPGDTVHLGEVPPDERFAVRLQSEGINAAVSTVSRIKTGVQGAIRIEPRDIGPAHAVDVIEWATDKHLAVRLQRDSLN